MRKVWSHIVDVEIGNHGTIPNPQAGGAPLDVEYWDNQPLARRDYHALELDAQTKFGQWQWSGNISWSGLFGNGTGEAASNPALPYGIQLYTQNPANGQPLYNPAYTSPYGRLVSLGSPSPMAMHVIVGYVQDDVLGKLTYGVTYRFNSGAHYDQARAFQLANIPALANDPNPAAFEYNYFTPNEYLNGQRGTGVFNASSYTDFSLQQDFHGFNCFGAKVVAFAKIAIYNFWNHQQLISWNTTYTANTSGVVGPGAPAWVPASSQFGQPVNPATDYGTPRSYVISAGFKF